MTFADILQIALSGVLFTIMIDKFIMEDMIFSFWGKFLDSHDKWYLKPLWGCVDCTNIWLIAVMFVLYLCLPMVWMIVFCISLGNIFLDFILKYR